MKNLPIHDVLPQIKFHLNHSNTLIVEAPPGAGKSTIVPISLLEESWIENKMIIMLEPRRVAARMVASQMAYLLNEKVGQTIGYQIKMDKCVSQSTKVLVVTEAILIRMLQSDQELSNVSMVIFDEFHERSIHTDLSLALSRQVQELLRDDLKLLIMSATLNSNELLNLLGDVPVVTSQGRLFDIEINHLPLTIKQPDEFTIHDRVTQTIMDSLKNDEGDILVFLEGVKSIRTIETSLLRLTASMNILVLPLYSSLNKKEQDKALLRSSQRKIILSTNIAQTSLTIEGVKVVIDSGFEKLSRYNNATGMNHLERHFISQDSATQRAGRAGRTTHGKCYQLWHQNRILQPSTKAEILRSDLSSLLLDLSLWGANGFDELVWLDIPNIKVIEHTQEVLHELHMLDENNTITHFGKEALSLGLHPRFSFMILKANELGWAYEACLLASMLGEKSIFKKTHYESGLSDAFEYLYEKNITHSFINGFVAKEILQQANYIFMKLKKLQTIRSNKEPFKLENLSVLLLFSYPDRLAKQRAENDTRYKLSNGKGAMLRRDDNLFNESLLVISTIQAKEKESLIFNALSISQKQLRFYFKSELKEKESIVYNKKEQRFDMNMVEYFFKLELGSTPLSHSKQRNLKPLLLNIIQKEGLSLLTWSSKAKELQNRVQFVKEQGGSLFDMNPESLVENLEWLEPYLEEVTTLKALENLDLHMILLAQLSWEEQQELEHLAPTHFKVPSGSNVKIDYTNVEAPNLAVKIQEVFGLNSTPKIMNNKVPLQIHLLTPAFRPIQITYDLNSFWKNSYDEVRKELRGKYKKHYWPENPYEAVATRKTKKFMS